MTKKELAELLKYSSPKELWVITFNNFLKRLVCPFKVRVLQDVGLLKRGQIVLVSEVKVTTELKTVYMINGQAYYYNHFDVLV
nr:hypothetical protein [uncultured Flavobacterium sp.]